MRPVPLTPLRIERRTIRPGKKVQLVQGSLFADDVEVVRATLLRLREQAGRVHAPSRSGGVDRADAAARARRSRSGGNVDPRAPASGTRSRSAGSAASGARPGRPACGCGSRCRSWPARSRHRSSGSRPPATSATASPPRSTGGATRASTPTSPSRCTGSRSGEWVGLDSATYPGARTGTGVAESVLHDEQGRIGAGHPDRPGRGALTRRSGWLARAGAALSGRGAGWIAVADRRPTDGRSSGACRGSPCCGGSAACASQSSCS